MSIKKFVCLLAIFSLLAVAIASGGTPGSDAPSSEAPSAETPSVETPSAEGNNNSTTSNSTEIERRFDFSFGSDQIEARIRIRQGDSESEVRHELRAESSGAEFRLEFEQKAGDTENQLRLRLRLFELIEYVPDQTPGYQNETIVNTYNTWDWGNGFSDDTPDQSTDSRVFSLKTVDGIFGITIRINRPAEGNITVNPEDVKFDIQLDADAMRAAGWLNGTEVALSAALASRLETEQVQEGSDDEHSIALGGSNASQFGALAVSWINYIQCGDNKVSVVPSALRVDNNQTDASDDSDSTAHVVTFAFVDLNAKSNTQCLWDPTVGALNANAVSAGTPSATTGPSSAINPATGVPTARASGATSVVASLAAFAAVVALF